MSAAQPNTDAPRGEDASHICGECGMCCDGSMFASVRLRPDEVAWASGRRLPLLPRDGHLSFRQPCAVLEVGPGARVCGDYARRPATCREFECEVLARYTRGDLSRSEASALVARGRELIAAIERRGGGGIVSLLAELSARGASTDGVSDDPQLLLDIAVLRTFVDRHFKRADRADSSAGSP